MLSEAPGSILSLVAGHRGLYTTGWTVRLIDALGSSLSPVVRSEGLSYHWRGWTIRLSEAAGSALSLFIKPVVDALRGFIRKGGR